MSENNANTLKKQDPVIKKKTNIQAANKGPTVTVRKKKERRTAAEEEKDALLALMKAEKIQRFDIKGWAKEVLMYLVFLILFTVLVFVTRNNTQIVTYQEHWLRILKQETDGIDTADQVESFLADGLIQKLVQPDYFVEDTYTSPGVSGFAYGTAIIGAITLRQVRVLPGRCGSAHDILKSKGLIDAVECMPHLSESSEDVFYYKQQNVVPPQVGVYDFFTYTPSSASRIQPVEGLLTTYPGGGYIAYLTADNLASTLQTVHDSHWIDPKTRAVFLDFIGYSPQTDMFILIQVLFEYAPGGVVYTSQNARAVFLDRYPLRTNTDRFIIFLEVVVYMIVCNYMWQEFKEMRKEGLVKYFDNGWNYIDWLNLILFIVVGFYKITNIRKFNSLFVETSNVIDPKSIAQQIDSLGTSLIYADQLNGINGFILWFKLFKYLSVSRRMVRLQRTILRTAYDVLSFCVLFFVIAYAFVVFGHLLFKSKVADFQTAVMTAVTLLRGVYGDINLTELIGTVGTFGFLYFLFWLVVSKTILLNVMIAILMRAYREVLEAEKEKASKTIFERIQDELKIQRIESGGNTMFYRMSKLFESNMSVMTNPQEADDKSAEIKKRLGWDEARQGWRPHGAQPRLPDTPPDTPRRGSQ